MVEREMLTIHVTREELQRIEALARQHGYPTMQEYLLALVEADAEDDEVDIAEAMRESLRDLREGRTYPIEKLRQMVEDDED